MHCNLFDDNELQALEKERSDSSKQTHLLCALFLVHGKLHKHLPNVPKHVWLESWHCKSSKTYSAFSQVGWFHFASTRALPDPSYNMLLVSSALASLYKYNHHTSTSRKHVFLVQCNLWKFDSTAPNVGYFFADWLDWHQLTIVLGLSCHMSPHFMFLGMYVLPVFQSASVFPSSSDSPAWKRSTWPVQKLLAAKESSGKVRNLVSHWHV